MPTTTQTPHTTPARTKLTRSSRWSCAVRAGLVLAAAGVAAMAGACTSSRERPLVAPSVVVAPYSTSMGEVVFAVAPLRNETGDTMAPTDQISEQLLAAVEEVRGVRTIPMSRTLMAMRALEFRGIRSPQELKALADALGADGIIFGSVSGYDPYGPAITISVGLFARGEKVGEYVETATMSTRDLQGLGAEPPAAPASAALVAASTWSDHLDGKNNGVQMAVRAYAQGRMSGPSALGWRRYLAAMPLFTEFATAEAVRGLMREEWVRVGGAGNGESPGMAGNQLGGNRGSLRGPGTGEDPRAQGTVTSAVDGE